MGTIEMVKMGCRILGSINNIAFYWILRFGIVYKFSWIGVILP